MPTEIARVKWGRVILGTVVGLVVAIVGNLVIQFAWGVVLGFQLRGAPPQEMLMAAFMSLPFQLLAVLWVLFGGFVGGRMAARGVESNGVRAGLVTGVLLAILAVAWRVISWGPDIWPLIHGIAAIAGGAIGGWFAGRRGREEFGLPA